MSDQVLNHTLIQAAASRVLPFVALAGIGLFLLYGVGFAAPEFLHNAAHDGRHAFAFPCH